jgi:hypothetical protein
MDESTRCFFERQCRAFQHLPQDSKVCLFLEENGSVYFYADHNARSVSAQSVSDFAVSMSAASPALEYSAQGQELPVCEVDDAPRPDGTHKPGRKKSTLNERVLRLDAEGEPAQPAAPQEEASVAPTRTQKWTASVMRKWGTYTPPDVDFTGVLCDMLLL